MDYQEAIYCMKVMADEEVCEDCNYYQLCDHTKQADMARIAISAMQELMKYKKIGTLEDLMKLKERELSGVELAKIFCNLNHLEKYKQIGTLEEVLEAVELQQADKPRIFRLSTHGAPDGYLYSCPNCEYRIIKKDNRGFYSGQRTKYCPNCGKRLDWSEEDD